jgi:hypothetical protein
LLKTGRKNLKKWQVWKNSQNKTSNTPQTKKPEHNFDFLKAMADVSVAALLILSLIILVPLTLVHHNGIFFSGLNRYTRYNHDSVMMIKGRSIAMINA